MDVNDDAIRRAAGVIMHALATRKRGMQRTHTIAEAIAKAQEREPQLTDGEIGQAYQWAQAGLLFGDTFATAKDDCNVIDLMRNCGLPVDDIMEQG